MISWLVEAIDGGSYLNMALWAAMLAVSSLALVGTWVVLRGLAFFGDALAHGVLPGVVVAFLAGADPRLGGLVAAGAMVLAMGVLRSRSPLPEDTSIGILFVGFLALAVVLITLGPSSGMGDLDRFLFGGLASVRGEDLVRQAIVLLVVVVGTIAFYRSLLVSTFDEDLARSLGINPTVASTALLGLVALTIVASFEVVGSLLVFAHLLAPAATSAVLFRRVPVIMVGAVVIGWISTIVGVMGSYHYGTAPEATMALTSVVIFLLAVGLGPKVQARPARS